MTRGFGAVGVWDMAGSPARASWRSNKVDARIGFIKKLILIFSKSGVERDFIRGCLASRWQAEPMDRRDACPRCSSFHFM
jgi:hypothetical protein